MSVPRCHCIRFTINNAILVKDPECPATQIHDLKARLLERHSK